MGMGNSIIDEREVHGYMVQIIGCWDNETTENEYDFFDFFIDGECINLGEACYKEHNEKPTDDDIIPHIDLYEFLKKDLTPTE